MVRIIQTPHTHTSQIHVASRERLRPHGLSENSVLQRSDTRTIQLIECASPGVACRLKQRRRQIAVGAGTSWAVSSNSTSAPGDGHWCWVGDQCQDECVHVFPTCCQSP